MGFSSSTPQLTCVNWSWSYRKRNSNRFKGCALPWTFESVRPDDSEVIEAVSLGKVKEMEAGKTNGGKGSKDYTVLHLDFSVPLLHRQRERERERPSLLILTSEDAPLWTSPHLQAHQAICYSRRVFNATSFSSMPRLQRLRKDGYVYIM